MAYQLTVAGLGPAGAELMTRGTWARIEAAEQILLRTRIHPTVEALDAAGISYETYDDFYERADDFDELYEAITDDLFARAARAMYSISFRAVPLLRSVQCSCCTNVQWRRMYRSRFCLR